MNKIFIITVILLATAQFIEAQDVISAQGDSYSNSTIKLDFTIGEVEISNYELNSIAISSGFQQGNLTILGLETLDSTIDVNAFPNPVANTILISQSRVISNLSYKLFNNAGRLMKKGEINKSLTSINVSSLAKGIYILSIFNEKLQEAKKIKIIKE